MSKTLTNITGKLSERKLRIHQDSKTDSKRGMRSCDWGWILKEFTSWSSCLNRFTTILTIALTTDSRRWSSSLLGQFSTKNYQDCCAVINWRHKIACVPSGPTNGWNGSSGDGIMYSRLIVNVLVERELINLNGQLGAPGKHRATRDQRQPLPWPVSHASAQQSTRLSHRLKKGTLARGVTDTRKRQTVDWMVRALHPVTTATTTKFIDRSRWTRKKFLQGRLPFNYTSTRNLQIEQIDRSDVVKHCPEEQTIHFRPLPVRLLSSSAHLFRKHMSVAV